MKRFLEAIEENEELRAKAENLEANPDAGYADYAALAQEYGFDLTEEDFAGIGNENSELDDEEVEMVAAGVIRPVTCVTYCSRSTTASYA